MADASGSPEATKFSTIVPTTPPPDATTRKLDMDATAADQQTLPTTTSPTANDHGAQAQAQGDHEVTEELPTVHDLLQTVAQLQSAVRAIGSDEDAALFDDDESPFTIYRSPNRGQRYYVDPRASLKHHVSSPDLSHIARNLSQGIYDPLKRGTSVISAISPQKDDPFGSRADRYASGLITPPPKRRESQFVPGRHASQSSVPRPTTRVAALTRENISLLPTPQDFARRRNTAGSISGGSQVSRTSARTDGGAVFSRLYQPDYYKNRDQKLRAIRDRQENLNFNFAPKTNTHHRTSISSKDGSVGSSSISSLQSAKTDVVNVSSRLYDPEYVRKRNARLNRLREEREMRNCTFAPAINPTSATAANAVPNRRSSSIHLNLK